MYWISCMAVRGGLVQVIDTWGQWAIVFVKWGIWAKISVLVCVNICNCCMLLRFFICSIVQFLLQAHKHLSPGEVQKLWNAVCGVHGEQNHLLKLCWCFANCVEEVEIYVYCVFQLQLGAWVFHPIHCSSWCIWCLCMVHDILWGWERCAGCCKMWNIAGWRHLR